MLSPLKVTRDPDRCTDCNLCTRVCPNRIDVARAARVGSPECTGCLECVAACPRQGALGVALPGSKPRRSLVLLPALLLATFFAVVLAAQLTGHWQTSIPYDDYARLIPNAGQYSH